MRSKRPIGYKDAGVNIDEADRAVAHIRKHARGSVVESRGERVEYVGGAA
jgi:hypothetical protein